LLRAVRDAVFIREQGVPEALGHFYKFRNSLSPNSAGELTEAIFGKRSFSALHSRLAW